MPEHYSAPDPLDEILAVRQAPDNATLSDLGLEHCTLLAVCPQHGAIEFLWVGNRGEEPPSKIKCEERNRMFANVICDYPCTVTGMRPSGA